MDHYPEYFPPSDIENSTEWSHTNRQNHDINNFSPYQYYQTYDNHIQSSYQNGFYPKSIDDVHAESSDSSSDQFHKNYINPYQSQFSINEENISIKPNNIPDPVEDNLILPPQYIYSPNSPSRNNITESRTTRDNTYHTRSHQRNNRNGGANNNNGSKVPCYRLCFSSCAGYCLYWMIFLLTIFFSGIMSCFLI